MNYFVLAGFIGYMNAGIIEPVTDLYVDGADLSFIANFFGGIINIIVFLFACIIGGVFLVIISLLFNKVYFKDCKLKDKDKLVSDIKALISMSSLVALFILSASMKSYFTLPMLFIYLMFPLLIYIFSDNRIDKITRDELKKQSTIKQAELEEERLKDKLASFN